VTTISLFSRTASAAAPLGAAGAAWADAADDWQNAASARASVDVLRPSVDIIMIIIPLPKNAREGGFLKPIRLSAYVMFYLIMVESTIRY
jgi:hypothetical protein